MPRHWPDAPGLIALLGCRGARYAMLTVAAQPEIAALGGQDGPGVLGGVRPDGTTLASAGNHGAVEGAVQPWDVATHRQIGGPLNGHDGMVAEVAVSRSS